MLNNISRKEISARAGIAIACVVLGGLLAVAIVGVKKDAKDTATDAAVAVVVERSYRNDLASWTGTMRGCGRSTLDRVEQYEVLSSSAEANRIVGTDPAQPKRTRDARLHESEEQARVASSLALRTSMTRAGRFQFCTIAFPIPMVPPDCPVCTKLLADAPVTADALKFP